MKASLSPSQFSKAFTGSKSLLVGDLLFKYKKEENPKLGFIVSKNMVMPSAETNSKGAVDQSILALKKMDLNIRLLLSP